MEKRLIKQVLIEQKEEVKKIYDEKFIKREIEESIKKCLRDNLIKVIIGVRRCGKSILALQVLKGENFGYINFDDERLIGVTASDLNDFLEVLIEINPNFNYLLLDEIQNIHGWELFVNRLKRNGYNIIITGSNSKLLSRELASHLTGRHISFELFPFSFAEFLRFKNVEFNQNDFYITEKRAEIKRLLSKYLDLGGFPEVYKLEARQQYLRDLYDKIITRDIVSRYKIRFVQDLKELALYLLTNFASKITYHKLKNIFGLGSIHTIKNYLANLENAYLILSVNPFSFKLKITLRYGKKVYSIDHALINSLSPQFTANQGRIMENLVFLQLKRKNKEIYYYSDNYEVDFVVKEGLGVKQLIQVCYDLSNFDTKKREINGLLKAGQKLKCNNLLLIASDQEAEEKYKGIKIKLIPLWKWLLEDKI